MRNALTISEKEGVASKTRAEELQSQKDQAYRDRERYKAQIDDTDSVLKKALDERNVLRIEKVLLEEKIKQVEGDLVNQQQQARDRHSTKPKVDTVAPSATASSESLIVVDSKTSTSDTHVSPQKRTKKPSGTPMNSLDKEIQVGSLPMTSHVARATPVQSSLIELLEVEVQPSFDALIGENNCKLLDFTVGIDFRFYLRGENLTYRRLRAMFWNFWIALSFLSPYFVHDVEGVSLHSGVFKKCAP